jgi:hypothetical protein
MKLRAERHQPACLAAHKLLNKLSVIIGNCDLLIEKTEAGTEHAQRLAGIREVADTAVKELLEHQHQAEAELRKASKRKVG